MEQPKWTIEYRERVNSALQEFFEEKHKIACNISPSSVELIDQMAELTMRGGKRFRPIVLFAGFMAVSPDQSLDVTINVSVALELLQSYLLIHDDWMDRDDLRRNGPSVHAKFRQSYSDPHLADCLAILVGDLASGYAWEMFNRAPIPLEQKQEVFDTYAAMHQNIIFGQQMDLIGNEDIERMYHLKSGSYTVQGPVKLGALLGGTTPEQLDALEAFSRPLGVAFQLRDDLLTAFGQSEIVGKTVGNDLRAGKNTLLVAEARKLMDPSELSILEGVMGNPDAPEKQLQEAIQLIASCGAKELVESRFKILLDSSRRCLQNTVLAPQGVQMLDQLVDMFAMRDR